MKKLIFLMLFLISTPSQALDGNGFLMICKSSDSTEFNTCQGYIGGILDNSYAAREAFIKIMPLAEQKKTIPRESRNCMPESIEINQARLIIIKWLEAHPENLHKRVIDDAHKALRDAFPCQD